MPVSAPAMARQLGRLTAAMGKPFSDAKVERQADEYAKAMGPLPEHAVEWAVSRLIRETDKYPKAATIRALAQQCPMLLNGSHDQSLRAQMQRWEADPWYGIESLAEDRTDCTSNPCPICDAVIVFSNRGMVITHDDQRHRETSASYSNIGQEEWKKLPPMEPLEPKKRLQHRTSPLPAAPEPTQISALIRQTADESWDLAQQERADAEQVA